MKIVIFGNKSTTKDLLFHLNLNKIKIDYLVTLDPENSKKFNIADQDLGLIKYARKNNIKVYSPKTYKLNEIEDINFFLREKFDLGISTGWQRLIPSLILDSFTNGVFGWHGSGFEFPNGRGRSPINWSIRLGLDTIYHNCFKYESGVDNGAIFEVEKIKIGEDEYIQDLLIKAKKHILNSSIRLIKAIKRKNLLLRKQPNHVWINLPKLSEKDGFLEPSIISFNQARNIVRSCSKPFQGATLKSKDNVVYKIWNLEEYEKTKNINFDFGEILIKEKKLIIKFVDNFGYSSDFEIY